MKQGVKGAALGALTGGVVWATTGMWQLFAMTMVGLLCALVFAPPRRAQPVREFVRVEIDKEVARRIADTQAGVMRKRKAQQFSVGKRCPDRDPKKIIRGYQGCTTKCYDYGGHRWAGDGAKGRPVVLPELEAKVFGHKVPPRLCACDNVPCTCSPHDLNVGRMYGRAVKRRGEPCRCSDYGGPCLCFEVD